MEIEIQLTESDLVAFADYHARHSAQVRASIRRSRIWFAILFISLGIGVWVSEQRTIFPALMALALLLLIILSPVITRSRIRRYFARSYHDPADRLEYASRKLRITDEALEHETKWGHGTVKWSAVVNIDQTANHGFVYLASDFALLIPRCAIGADSFRQSMETASARWQKAVAESSADADARD